MMAYYLGQISYAKDQIKAMTANPQDRSTEARKLVEGLGGKLLHFFFSFGDYDAVFLVEAPDNTTIAAGSLAVSAAGTVSAFKTTPLLTMEEAMNAMKIAGTAIGTYKPPAG